MTAALNEDFKGAVNFLHTGERFLVVSHVNPDGDAIGSTCAVGRILEKLGKAFVLVNASKVPEKFKFLPGAQQIRSLEEAGDMEPFSRVVAVDVADAARMGEISPMLTGDAEVLNIDHHVTNDRFGAVNLVIDDAAATAEVLCHLADALGVEWDQPLAECLYTGLLTDTGGFRYSNTTHNVMELAARLLGQGVDAAEIADRAIETISRSQLALLRRALDTLAFSESGQVAWMWLTRQDFTEAEAAEDEMEGIVNYARNVAGVDVGILFRETPEGEVKVSLRSREVVDVGELAQSFGGGGHARAAGCTLTGTRKQVEEEILVRVTQRLQRGDG
ncbi:DHH family phosphoesterase [Salinithrix halophila]|uniref:Bifunctional oligoribonuclease/PAP phosphatase NrnA n=1 Tax=Salinithrix halophila TaxID=1485204 RepID=A0ABV8JKZ0_9BACL